MPHPDPWFSKILASAAKQGMSDSDLMRLYLGAEPSRTDRSLFTAYKSGMKRPGICRLRDMAVAVGMDLRQVRRIRRGA